MIADILHGIVNGNDKFFDNPLQIFYRACYIGIDMEIF